MYLKLVDIDEFCEELPEVNNAKMFESGKFSKKGLFSQQIFGPVKSYYCACSKAGYRGRSSTEKTCKVCNVDIVSAEERRKRFARISLPFPILNPIYYYVLCNIKPSLKTVVYNMLLYKDAYYFDDNEVLRKTGIGGVVEDAEGTPIKVNKLEGLPGVRKLIDHYIEKNKTKPDEIQFLKDNLDRLTTKNVIVIPPDFRPCGKNQSGVNVSDELNQHYSFLIVRSNHLKLNDVPLKETDDIFRSNFRYIQRAVFNLYDHVLQKMSKKKGLIRSNILGKRVDFSGRAVISPDPTLTLDRCRIPYYMLMELLKPQLTAYLVNNRICKRPNVAYKRIDDCIKKQDDSLFDVVQQFCQDKYCILNRQPTLHRLGVLGFKLSVHLGNTIQIHPMMCFPYNADFDGDQMAIYFPVTEDAKQDIVDRIGIWRNLINPTDLTLVPRPNQDIILGIWAASTSTNPQTKEIKGKELPFEKYILNTCFPDDYPIQTKPITKNRLITILNDIVFKYPPSVVMDTLDKVKRLGFMMSTIKGYTLGIDDLHTPEIDAIAKGLTGKKEEDLEHMQSDEVMDVLKKLPVADFIESGARGSWDQCKQLVLSRGYVSDASGKILDNVIRGSFVSGLDQKEFFDSSWGSRKGLLDTALSTGDSGYLTRQLIYSTINIELDPDLEDCGTTDGLKIKVDTPKIAKTLLWRYYMEDGELKKVNRKTYKDLIGKTVEVRSPIYCQSPKVCQKCYGDLFRILHSNQIGVIATQAVGERTTQLVLRTFHTSGVATTTGGGKHDRQEDIVSGMGLAQKIFHDPDSLGVQSPSTLTREIFGLFNPHKPIQMVHYEILVASMMWKDRIPWRLTPNRVNEDFDWVSILKVPSQSSWLLGAAFSNLRNKLLDGVIKNRVDVPSSLTELFRL